MVITMNMSSYEIEQDEEAIEYGDEIMNAGWNPAVELVNTQLQEVGTDEQLPMAADFPVLNTPDDIASVATEIFMRKMYFSQH
jgi:hypothetical protein